MKQFQYLTLPLVCLSVSTCGCHRRDRQTAQHVSIGMQYSAAKSILADLGLVGEENQGKDPNQSIFHFYKITPHASLFIWVNKSSGEIKEMGVMEHGGSQERHFIQLREFVFAQGQFKAIPLDDVSTAPASQESRLDETR